MKWIKRMTPRRVAGLGLFVATVIVVMTEKILRLQETLLDRMDHIEHDIEEVKAERVSIQ